MFVFARAITYASLFTAFLLVFLPARIVARSGLTRPERWGALQVSGLLLVLLGSILAASCVVTFALVGRGTPAPFDPPTRLVVDGPYRYVRNPMYVGAIVALAGAASFFRSLPLLAYDAAFALLAHLLVVAYEEPTLRSTFGADYDAYRARVGRWWPRFLPARGGTA